MQRQFTVLLSSSKTEIEMFLALLLSAVDDAFMDGMRQILGFDSNRKNLVDPLVEIHFAGKTVRVMSWNLLQHSGTQERTTEPNSVFAFFLRSAQRSWRKTPTHSGTRCWACLSGYGTQTMETHDHATKTNVPIFSHGLLCFPVSLHVREDEDQNSGLVNFGQHIVDLIFILISCWH